MKRENYQPSYSLVAVLVNLLARQNCIKDYVDLLVKVIRRLENDGVEVLPLLSLLKELAPEFFYRYLENLLKQKRFNEFYKEITKVIKTTNERELSVRLNKIFSAVFSSVEPSPEVLVYTAHQLEPINKELAFKFYKWAGSLYESNENALYAIKAYTKALALFEDKNLKRQVVSLLVKEIKDVESLKDVIEKTKDCNLWLFVFESFKENGKLSALSYFVKEMEEKTRAFFLTLIMAEEKGIIPVDLKETALQSKCGSVLEGYLGAKYPDLKYASDYVDPDSLIQEASVKLSDITLDLDDIFEGG